MTEVRDCDRTKLACKFILFVAEANAEVPPHLHLVLNIVLPLDCSLCEPLIEKPGIDVNC